MKNNQQLPLGVRLQDNATFESFYPGGNQPVLSALHQWLRGGGLDPYFYLWGESGVGCTHLLQAVCHEAVNLGLTACYLPMSTLLTEAEPAVLEGLEHTPVIGVDDIQAIAGDREWEEAFFHFFNRVRAKEARLLIVGNQAPRGLPIRLPDLHSRLTWGTTFQIHALTDDEKLGALQLRAKARGLILTEEVGRFLLRRSARDMRCLYDTLDQLDEASLRAQRRLTIPFVKEVLTL